MIHSPLPHLLLSLQMVDLKQQLDVIDYFGVVAVWLCFFSVVFIISVTCILWCCVSKDDDSTVFAKWGMGPKPRRNPVNHVASD